MNRRFWNRLGIVRKLGWRNVYAAVQHRGLSRTGVYERALPSARLELSESVWRPCKELVEAPAEFRRSGVAAVTRRADEICRGGVRRVGQELGPAGGRSDGPKGEYRGFWGWQFS